MPMAITKWCIPNPCALFLSDSEAKMSRLPFVPMHESLTPNTTMYTTRDV